jgi:hypothetical protein
MIEKYKFETNEQNRTFDSYNDVDCFNYSDVHDYIKFIKHGYCKVTDHACREIRLRKMTREEGFKMVKKYYQKPLKKLNLFLDWLGITENSFYYIINQHRNRDIWMLSDKFVWELKENYLEQLQQSGSDKTKLATIEEFSEFKKTPKGLSTDHLDKYILIGKGTI